MVVVVVVVLSLIRTRLMGAVKKKVGRERERRKPAIMLPKKLSLLGWQRA